MTTHPRMDQNAQVTHRLPADEFITGSAIHAKTDLTCFCLVHDLHVQLCRSTFEIVTYIIL